MSGSLSRLAGRFSYAPTLRVNPVTSTLAPNAGALGGDAAAAPSLPLRAAAAPVTRGGMAAAPMAPQLGGGVMAGSFTPDRPRQDLMDGAGGSAQGGYGGAGPSGAPSTGSFGSDLSGFGRSAGTAAAGLTNPMGIAGFGLGTIASGFASAIGAPQTAAAIARGIGLPGVAPVGYGGMGENAKGVETAFGMSMNPPGTPMGPPSDMAAIGPAPDKESLSAPTAEALGGGYADKSGTDFGAADNAGPSGTGSTSENTGPGTGSEDGGGKSGWMQGGYTGPGHPAEPAGTVHRGEVVIPAAAVQQYGIAPLMMLARGQVPPSRLAALLG